MNRVRLALVPVLVLLAAALAAAPGCRKAGDQAGLPEDLLALLPAGPHVIVSLSSLDDWEARRLALADSTHGAPVLPGGALDDVDLAALFAEKLPAAAAVAAGDRPLALALGLPAPMTNQVDAVLVFPVVGSAVPGDLADGETFHAQLAHGDYVALATDAAYAPADTVPAIARDRVPGLVSVAVDLEALVAMVRPMVQMGLAAMAAAPPPAEGGPPGGMTADEAAAMSEMMGVIMDSVRRWDMAMDVDDRELAMDFRLDMVPGSPLVPGPQPDFARALALSGALPPDAPLKVAAAMDQTVQMEVFRDVTLANMRGDLDALPPDLADGIAAWFEGYLDGYDLVNVPMAAAADVGPDGVAVQAVVAADDPDALLAHVERQVTALDALGVGLTVTPVATAELGGVAVRGWDLAWDDDLMATILGHAAAADVAPTGGQLARNLGLLRELAPGLRVARVGDLVVLATAGDDRALAGFLAAVAAPGAPDPRLAELAAPYGDAAVEVVRGDLAAILATVLETMHGVGPEDTAALRGQSLDLAAVATVDGPRVGFAGRVDVAGLRSTVETFQGMIAAMEAAEKEAAAETGAP